jgi:hypothetical protein
VILGLAVATAAPLFSIVMHVVHRGPGATLRFFFGDTPVEVAFLDVLSLPLLLVRVMRLISSRHNEFLPLIRECKIEELCG